MTVSPFCFSPPPRDLPTRSGTALVSMKSKSPGLSGPQTGVVDADSWKRHYRGPTDPHGPIFKPQPVAAGQIVSIQRPVDLQRLAEPAWSIDQLAFNFNGSNQHGGGKLLPLRDHVEAVIHAVDEIHVGEAGRAVEHVGSFRSPFRGMAGLILRPDIGFDFNDFAGEFTTID